MATNKQQTTNYKQIFWCIFVVFLGLLWRWGYLEISNVVVGYDIERIQKKIEKKDAELRSFSDKPWFDKLRHVQALEQNNTTMPWSDHINAIMAIFGELLDVDNSDTANIKFSNFEISLEKIRLDWHVMNLRILYQWSRESEKDKPGLIAKFEELDFLDNISIKTYEKTEWDYGFDFTLTANVINNGK